MSRIKPPTASEPIAEPPRLLSLEGPQRDLLERANLGFRRGLDENKAWLHVTHRLDEPWLARFRWPLGVALAAAVVAVLFVGASSFTRRGEVAGRIAPETSTAARPNVPETVRSGEALREGANRLGDGSTVQLDTAAVVALTSRGEKHTRLQVKAGSASFQVEPQKPDQSFAVEAGAYEFQVLGTAFTVTAAADAVELDVSEGRVAVAREGKLLATVGAGEHWSSILDESEEQARRDKINVPKAARAAEPAEPQAPEAEVQATEVEAPVQENCAALVRSGDRGRALACYSAQAKGNGLSAEVALYELGRLKRSSGDQSGAIDVLREYRSRFPQGQLQGEVALTLVELYGASGQSRQALEESERLLGTQYGRERAEQLHWLRGNVYRETLHDYVRAQAEYEQINPGAKLGAEALYYTAVCLEQRGQPQAARQAYEQYLQHPRATRKSAAERKLEQLLP